MIVFRVADRQICQVSQITHGYLPFVDYAERESPIGVYALVDVIVTDKAAFAERAFNAFSASELRANLDKYKNHIREIFSSAFVEIDARSPRSARGIIISLVDGSFPNEAAQDLTPEQQQRIIDVGIMWELEEVAQINRDMQTELLALEITEDMLLEQAQEITLRIANAQPWLPWASSSPQAPAEATPEGNTPAPPAPISGFTLS